MHFKSPRDAGEAGLVLVPEDRAGEGLVAIRSARENVALMALSGSAVRYGFVRHRDVWRKVDQVVRDFEVRPLEMGLTAATFSGGNQQKLLLARAILGKPVVLIVDGPTIGVDVGARVQVQRILRSVAESGSGVLMISNDVEEIAALSDRVLVMRRGAIVAEFEKGEIDKVTLVSVMSASSPLERPILAKSPA